MTAPIDIRPCDLTIVLEILRTVLPPAAKVWVFGSRAKWTTKDASDLDLAIDAGRPLTRAESNNLADAFEESDLPYKVDVVDMYTVSDTFRPYVEKERVPLMWEDKGWREVTVGEFSPFLYGKGLPKSKRKQGNIPIVSSSGITGCHDTALVQTKGIVIGRKGTVGKITLIKEPFWPIDTAFYIEDEPEKRDLDFTYYLLQTLGLQHMNSDSAVPGLNRDNAHSRKVMIPPLSEQKAIASVLGALDDKIALNRKICQTLEEMAKALFKSWFVDFDPVHAKMRGETPYGMDAATAALFPDKLVESELGLIPEGWGVKSLSQIAKFLNGLALQKYPAIDSNFLPVIKIPQIRQGSTKNADKASLNVPKDYVIDDGDVLFSWSGSLVQVLWAGGKGALNQHLFKVTSNQYPKWFYYLWIDQHMSWFQSIAASKATTMGHIQRTHLDQAKALVPPASLLEKMNFNFFVIFDKLIQLKIENKTLEQTREYLLSRLMSGEVGIGND